MFSSNHCRFFDLFLVILFTPFWVSLTLFCLFAVYIFDGKPFFFMHKRVGLNGKIFYLYKIRTMRLNNKGVNEITKVGKFLRKASLDEIPQFFNVIMGNMSIVGPRPMPYEALNGIDKDKIKIRNSVLPGLTGLSQIHSLGVKRAFEEKLDLDILFAKNFECKLYFTIILKTPKTLIRRFINNKTGDTL